MEHCRHEDSIALVKSGLRLPNCGYRFHAFKGGAILGRRTVCREWFYGTPRSVAKEDWFPGSVDSRQGRGLPVVYRKMVTGFCPYPMVRDLELHSLASVNGSEGDCRE